MPFRIFMVVDRWFGRLLRLLEATHQGFWLGVLDRPQLHHLAKSQYLAWEQYRQRDYNLSGFWEWEKNIIDQYFSDCRSILLGAAGGGREVVALSRRNIQVDAFDPSPALVKSCQNLLAGEGICARVILAPPDEVPPELGIYDGLIVGWGGYIHVAGRENRIRFLKQFHSHASPGSPLLLSFLWRNEESKHFFWIYKIAQICRRLLLIGEPVELGDTLYGTFDHYFTREEIEQELTAAGFKLEYYTDRPYGHAVAKVVES